MSKPASWCTIDLTSSYQLAIDRDTDKYHGNGFGDRPYLILPVGDRQ